MSDTQSTVDDFLVARDRAPSAAPPSSIGEIWNANWDAAGLSTLAAGKSFGDARSDIVAAIEAAAGKPLGQVAREQGLPLGAAGTPDENIRELADVAGTLPEDAQKRIAPLLDWRRNAQEKAAQIERTAADVNANAYGLSSNAVRLAAGLARTSVDPLNLAAMAVTAPIGGELALPLWQVLARQALAGGAAQLLAEPSIQGTRAALGLEHGMGMAAEDVLGAAAGNAVFAGGLTGLLRGGAMALRVARARLGERPAGTPLSESPSPIADHPLAPADLDAAARLTERDQTVEALAPDQTAAGQAGHAARLGDAADLLESGRLPPTMERLSELQLGEIAGTAGDIEKAAAAARAKLDATQEKLSSGRVDLAGRAAELEPLRQDVAGLQTDLADARERLAAARGPTDAATQERLAAIDTELQQPAVTAQRRTALEGERATITETLAATAPADTRAVASLQQEVIGLERALGRNQKSLDKSQAALDKTAAGLTAREQAVKTAGADLEARRSSQRQIVANELRRAIARLSSEGYGVRLPRADAELFAEHVLAAKPEELAGATRDVTDALVQRRIADTGLMVQREMPPPVSELPLPKEAKVEHAPEAVPPKPPAAEKAAAPIGDPALAADAARVLAEAGGDFRIRLDEGGDQVSARDMLAAADEDATAARELADCAAMEVKE